MRQTRPALIAALLTLPAAAHGLHGPHGHAELAPPPAVSAVPPTLPGEGATTGHGRFTFEHRPLELPAAMAAQLVHAHGGFARNPEREGGDGSVFFALKGVGLLRLKPDLSGIEVVGGDPAFTGVNVHNAAILRRDGADFLALPSDEAQRAFLTRLDGELVRTFPNPYEIAGEEGAFRVCDLEYVDGTLFAVNGYADNVVFTTDPFEHVAGDPLTGLWGPLRFGGAGTEHGRFGTAHGITRVPGTNAFTIADRANSRLETYTPEGRYVGGIELPPGSLPCDVDYHGDLTLVGCLRGPGGSTPAPIYLYERGNLVAELNIGRDLGLEGFTHIHNAAFRVVPQPDGGERLFVLAYAWNPGNFAILEHVPE